MKKLTVMAACAALLLGGGCFLKANQMNNLLVNENILAFTEDGEGACSSGNAEYNDFSGPCLLDGSVSLNAEGIANILGIKIAGSTAKLTAEGKIYYGDYHNCERGGKQTCTPVTCEQLLAVWTNFIKAFN